MKICKDHWAALRNAIHVRGLGHLGASSGKEAMERAKKEIEGTATDATFDPLMAANNNIWSKALELGGLYLMTRKADGSEYCPLCEVELQYEPGTAQKWIDGCTDAIRSYCEQRGLIRGDRA